MAAGDTGGAATTDTTKTHSNAHARYTAEVKANHPYARKSNETLSRPALAGFCNRQPPGRCPPFVSRFRLVPRHQVPVTREIMRKWSAAMKRLRPKEHTANVTERDEVREAALHGRWQHLRHNRETRLVQTRASCSVFVLAEMYPVIPPVYIWSGTLCSSVTRSKRHWLARWHRTTSHFDRHAYYCGLQRVF